ncbi:undecaprenyl-diphosphate phosphatase [Geomonas sp.]|uniref:undecaprenyl-diphosphate phosphatase n=1 Tax=Geomonas sp. TaxID=2651584 RepID=UPI002B47364D|nr:undecaprenyl-diphosphate phosphatase [Geomonas sp.]HJV35803.1 undecaprenyl-diphosphate phosphatase [Geomonas sp.]
MTILQILILAAVQGAAELLPVSSSAHVIVAAKLMGLDPTTPEMTMLLVMLHTGTMFAVILFFWKGWKESFFSSSKRFKKFCGRIFIATLLTGVVGLGVKGVIERVAFGKGARAEIEMLFGNLGLISLSLAVVGVLIICAGLKRVRFPKQEVGMAEACGIGAVQGLCLPLRGFSRSGATISTGLLMGMAKERLEEFSFALAVVLTPPVIAREVLRLMKAHAVSVAAGGPLLHLFVPSLCGMVLSFVSGLLALRWLSSWLEKGRWHYFGYYCLAASAIVFTLYRMGM